MIIGKIFHNGEEASIDWDRKFLDEFKGIPRLDVFQDVMVSADEEYHWYLASWHKHEWKQRKKDQALKEAQDEEE